MRTERRLVGLLLGILLVLDIGSMQHLTRTADEGAHLAYGRQILRLDSSRPRGWRRPHDLMPATALNALPSRIAGWLGPGVVKRWLAKLSTGRYVTVVFSVVIAVVVFRWAREMYGVSAGLLALTLYVFDPNILAHSQLVTGDLYATGMITLSVYRFWRLLNGGGWRRTVLTGLLLGLSQLAKYTCLFLLPLFGLLALGRAAPDLWTLTASRRFADLGRRLLTFLTTAVVLLTVSLLVVNLGFLVNGTGAPLSAYHFRADLLRTTQRWLRPVGALPVPLPRPFLQGMDWLLAQERKGTNVYLLGELGRGGEPGRPFPGYYLVASLFKVPIATQLVILAAGVAYVVRRRRFDFRRNEWILLGPVLVFTVYFNFLYRLQIGIRHFLVVFPLLYVFAGSLLAVPTPRRRWATASLAGALLYLVVSVLSYYPHYLSYFNELVWDRKQAYTILADSNLDWGQNGWYLARWLTRHPGAVVEPDRPQAGTIVVGANWLTGVSGPERFRWLREHFKPVDHVAYSYLVFTVTPEDLKRLDQVSARPRVFLDTGGGKPDDKGRLRVGRVPAWPTDRRPALGRRRQPR